MSKGNWKLNGETVKFDVDGKLIDGFKRFTACVESGTPFKTLAVYGIETHLGIDEGDTRKVSDELRFQGYSNYFVLAAAARFVHDYEHAGLNRDVLFSNTEILETIKNHKKLEDFVAAARGNCDTLPESPVAAVLYLGSNKNINNPLVSKFLKGLKTGANLPVGNPILVLRDFWATNLPMQQYRPTRSAIRAHIVLAWNALVQRKKITKKDLKWYESGPKKQEFPQLLIAK